MSSAIAELRKINFMESEFKTRRLYALDNYTAALTYMKSHRDFKRLFRLLLAILHTCRVRKRIACSIKITCPPTNPLQRIENWVGDNIK